MFESNAERLRRQQLNRDLSAINAGVNDQRSSSDPNITPLVSSIGTNPDFGEKLQRQDISGSVWSKLEEHGKGSKHHHYPLNLATDDVENFLFIKIYQGHSEAYQTAERKVQHLEWLEERLDEINAETGATAASMMAALSGFTDGEWFNDNQKLIIMGGGDSDYRLAVESYETIEGNKSFSNVNMLNSEVRRAGSAYTYKPVDLQTAKEEFAEAKKIEKGQRDIQRKKQKASGSKASTHSTARIRKAEFQMEETVALYLPQKLNVAGMNTYDTPEFALLKDIEGMVNLDMKALGPTIIRKTAGVVDSMANIAGADLNAKRAIAAATGRVTNPRRETLYVSPEMRKFEFAFEFTPRNEKESWAVRDIIKTLRKHAYPKLAMGGYFYHMPAEFHLEYYSPNNDGGYTQNEWLNRILPCVLQEVNVDYTGSGQVSMFESGAPTHINVTLSFQETELLHQDRILDGY